MMITSHIQSWGPKGSEPWCWEKRSRSKRRGSKNKYPESPPLPIFICNIHIKYQATPIVRDSLILVGNTWSEILTLYHREDIRLSIIVMDYHKKNLLDLIDDRSLKCKLLFSFDQLKSDLLPLRASVTDRLRWSSHSVTSNCIVFEAASGMGTDSMWSACVALYSWDEFR